MRGEPESSGPAASSVRASGAEETSPKVLIADDDITTRLLLKRLLTKWGYPVEVMKDGTGVLEALEAPDGPAIALLDWEMPGMDGVDICRRLRQSRRGNAVYAILLSGRTAVEDVAEGLASGADDYMRKPCDGRELRSRIHAGERMLLSRRELAESERWHRSLLEHLPLPILTVELPSLRICLANKIALKVFGEKVISEVPRCSLLDVSADVLGDGREASRSLDEMLAISHSSVASSEWTCRREDGSLFPAIMQMTRVKRATQSFAQVAFMDVTSQKRLEEQLEDKVAERTKELHKSHGRLQEEKERAQQYLDVAGVTLLVIDRQGKITLLNRQGIELLDVKPSDVDGADWFAKFVPDDDRERAAELFQKLLAGATNDVEFFESQIQTTQGEQKLVQWHNVPLHDAAGKVVGMLSSGQDITERRRIEARLQQAQKLESVGQLASGLAHEMNTPLQFVSDNVHFLQKAFSKLMDLSEKHLELYELCKSGEVTEAIVKEQKKAFSKSKISFLKKQLPGALEQSTSGLARMAQLVQSMKAFAAPSIVEMDSVDLNDIIESLLRDPDTVELSNVEVTTSLADDCPQVQCLVSDIQKVVAELLNNARDSIEERLAAEGKTPEAEDSTAEDSTAEDSAVKEPVAGQIRLSTEFDEQWFVIRVVDNGTGMNEEVQRRAFDPFYTTKVVGSGTGQGLAVAHSIVVDKHGGQLKVESQLGEGATFVVSLPRVRNEATNDG